MVWLTVISLLTIVCEVFADYCGDNLFCDSPYKCCATKRGCCYDVVLLNNSRHYRLQIWNMWYFWFLIIFMMMSCFGGCGYYRRRRLSMLTRTSNRLPLRPTAILEPTQRRTRSRSHEGSAQQFNFFAYIGPGVTLPEPISNLPPAYAEVINQPVQYPFSKIELPPYPGNDKPDDDHLAFASPPPPSSSMLPHQETCLPPPYSEHTYSSSQPPFIPVPGDVSSQDVPPQRSVDQVSVGLTERANSSAADSTTTGNSH
uniref:WW domain binding protein VOPP1 n=1 Tax=Arion vulgaris TaxID=1028688 RepID=A0A0B6YMM4_9EUPU